MSISLEGWVREEKDEYIGGGVGVYGGGGGGYARVRWLCQRQGDVCKWRGWCANERVGMSMVVGWHG